MEEKKLNPFFSLAVKKDLKGKDKNVLNLEPMHVKEEEIREPEKTIVDENLQEHSGTNTATPELPTLTEEDNGNGNKTIIIVVVVILLLAGITVGGILVSRGAFKNKGKTGETPSSSPAAAPSFMPSPSPAAQIDRKELKIEILNGSGESGVAKKAADILELLGYTDIKTGNADNYDYRETEIQTDKEVYFDLLAEDLSSDYSIASKSSSLPKDSDFDAIIVIGKE